MLELQSETSLSASGYDGVVLIASSTADLTAEFQPCYDAINEQAKLDKTVETVGACVKVALPSSRLIYSPTGPVDRDYDDVRRYYDAGHTGIERAINAGWKRPLLAVAPSKASTIFTHSSFVGLLGALQKLYVPLEIREDVPERKKKLEILGFLGSPQSVRVAQSLESGRYVARDIGGSDPERMAPPRVEEYVRQTFENSGVDVEVISDDEVLLKDYPLFSAVNRCAKGVDRHQGRIIYLTYKGSGPIHETLLLVGKGVTYDTGGADIKAGGVMAGMHRDKCGAAAVAGFMQIINLLKPPNLKVVCGMAVVRNSVGSNCYVADEIIKSRAGVRVRVRNTDAEGRMAMADVLCRMKELAVNEVNPQLFTIATLTGHACIAVGEAYTAIMDNGPARLQQVARKIQDAGEQIADPLELSTIRREDFEFNAAKCEYEDIVQSNDLPSTRTPRGHQLPAAFLILASGLDKNGKDSAQPIKYTHLDIAGSAASYPTVPTAAPVLALSRAFMPQFFKDL